MNLLTKLHCKIMIVAPSIFIGGIAIVLFVEKYLGLVIPTWIIVLITLVYFLVDAIMRISFWRKRDLLLTPEEIASHAAKIFLAVIPIEISFGLLGILLVLVN